MNIYCYSVTLCRNLFPNPPRDFPCHERDSSDKARDAEMCSPVSQSIAISNHVPRREEFGLTSNDSGQGHGHSTQESFSEREQCQTSRRCQIGKFRPVGDSASPEQPKYPRLRRSRCRIEQKLFLHLILLSFTSAWIPCHRTTLVSTTVRWYGA